MSVLADLRARVVAALTGLAPSGDDWPAHDGPVDSVTPPCFVLVWAEPWLALHTVCSYMAQLDVLCIGARIDPQPGYEQLEQLVSAAIPALEAAALTVAGTGAPGPLEVGGLTYQAARIHVVQPVTFGGA
jgi:hypothetical protein